VGEWKKARSVKFGGRREEQIFEIADRFAPFFKNPLTDVACFAVDWLWVCIQKGMLENIMGAIQELRCTSVSDAAVAQEARKLKPSQRERPAVLSVGRGPLHFLANRPGRARAGEAEAVDMARFITPFPSLHLLPVRHGAQG
jgi:hypothetical protein